MRFAIPAVLIALVLIVALLALAVTPGDGARALPTSTAPYVLALRAQGGNAPIDPTTAPSASPSVKPSGPMRTPGPAVTHQVIPPIRWFRGQATHWNSLGAGIYVATNPDLHIAMGSVIQVCDAHARGCVPARVATTCACLGPNSGRIIDLSNDLFIHFAALSRGVVQVVLEVQP